MKRIQFKKNTSAGVSVSATWTSSTTTGNFLVGVVTAQDINLDTPTPPTITAPAGWTQAVTTTRTAAGLTAPIQRISIYYKENAASQSSTGNFTADVASNGMTLIVAEYQNVNTASSIDKTASNVGKSASPSTGTTATTAQANELLIGGLGALASITYSSPTNSFNLVDSQNNGSISNALLDRIVSATGTYSTGATQSASSDWDGVIATFKGSAEPAGGAFLLKMI